VDESEDEEEEEEEKEEEKAEEEEASWFFRLSDSRVRSKIRSSLIF
jgi:hypothetical protein